MSNTSQGPGWWLASDGKWYPPELWTGPAGMRPVVAPAQPQPIHPPQSPPGPAASPSGNESYGQYPQQGQYMPGYGSPYGQAVQPKTNGMAIASLVCSCAGLFLLPAIAGIIFGFIARAQIKRSNGGQKGNGLALAGIIVGFGWLALVVLGLALGGGHPANDSNSGIVDPGILTGPLGLGGAIG